MTTAEICSLSQLSLENIRALKQEFDAAFGILVTSGRREDLPKVAALQQQLEAELRTRPIACSVEQISEQTLIYIGKLEPGIFHKLPRTFQELYTSFPEGKFLRTQIGIGGQTGRELSDVLMQEDITTTSYADYMLDGPDFTALQTAEQIDLIELKLGDLGIGDNPSLAQIYERITELGLELCPAEVGPHYLLAHQDIDRDIFIGMKTMVGFDTESCIFSLGGPPNERPWLDGAWTHSGAYEWNRESRFLFRLAKTE